MPGDTRRLLGMILALLLAVSPFAYDRAAPLDLRDQLTGTSDGIEEHVITFASPKGGRATGFLFVPKRPGKLPAILAQHGAPGFAGQMRNRALYLARHGAIVLTLDAPFARRKGDLAFGAAQLRADAIQLAVDQQRAFDLLIARPDVDAKRLAYVGVSFGGAAGTLLAGIEHRPRAYGLVVADGGWVEHFMIDGKPTGPLLELSAAEIKSIDDLQGSHYVAQATPGAIFFQSGTQDEFVPATNAKRVQALAPKPLIKWYDSGHRLPPAAAVDQLAWLHEKIGTDPPVPADDEGVAPYKP
jgi:dienelactone hydrolase